MLFIELKKALKNSVQEPDVRKKTFRLSSHTPGYSLMSFQGHVQVSITNYVLYFKNPPKQNFKAIKQFIKYGNHLK